MSCWYLEKAKEKLVLAKCNLNMDDGRLPLPGIISSMFVSNSTKQNIFSDKKFRGWVYCDL